MALKHEGVGDTMFSTSLRRRNICEGAVRYLKKGGRFSTQSTVEQRERYHQSTISVSFLSESTEPTKREILSKVAKIYDPLGLVSPITLGGKFPYCDICDAKLAWDAKLPSNLMQSWVCWEKKLPSHVIVP